MNCEMAQQAIALAQGQIEPPAAEVGAEPEYQDLAAHLEGCSACREELAFYRALADAIEETPQLEPSPNLVARARARLDSELDLRPAAGPFSRFLLNLSFGAGRLRAAPVLTSSLVLIGLLSGAYAGFQAGRRAHIAEQTAPLPIADTADAAPPRIAAVTGIVRVAGGDSESVEIHYDRLVPDFLPGSLDDPAIRSLLLLGARNPDDPSVRGEAIALLARECRNGHQCDSTATALKGANQPDQAAQAAQHQPVLSTLLASLRTDREPQVRISALHGLEPFIARDLRVRNAVLDTLINDPDVGVRNEAVRMLPPVQVDSSVREVLHTVANRDGDPGLRSASQQLLDSTPQIQ
jgi:hypothetical protein